MCISVEAVAVAKHTDIQTLSALIVLHDIDEFTSIDAASTIPLPLYCCMLAEAQQSSRALSACCCIAAELTALLLLLH
jgi:hypothetical protein